MFIRCTLWLVARFKNRLFYYLIWQNPETEQCDCVWTWFQIIWVPFPFPTFIQLTHFASPSENKNHRENRSDALELSASHRTRLTDKRSKTSSALWELLALLLINRTPRVKQCKQQYRIKNEPHHWAHRLFQPCKYEQDSVLWQIQALTVHVTAETSAQWKGGIMCLSA